MNEYEGGIVIDGSLEDEEQPEEVEEVSESKKNFYFVAAVVFVVVILVSLFGFRFFIKPEPIKTLDDVMKETITGDSVSETNYLYNGFAFVKVNNLWHTRWQSGKMIYNVPLHFSPRDVEDIPIEGKLDPRFFQDTVFITFDPVQPILRYIALGAGELSINMAQVFDVTPLAACTMNETLACHSRPILTCENTDAAVIYLKHDLETKIILKGNCIVIQGPEMDMVRALDRLILMWYGIM